MYPGTQAGNVTASLSLRMAYLGLPARLMQRRDERATGMAESMLLVTQRYAGNRDIQVCY